MNRTLESTKIDLQRAEVEAECPIHGAYMASVMRIGGKELRTGCPLCQEQEEKAEQSQEVRQPSTTELYLLNKVGVPRRYLGKTFDDFLIDPSNETTSRQQQAIVAAAKLYVEQFDKVLRKGTSILMYGNPGTGKTMLACIIASSIVDRYPRTTVKMGTLLSLIRTIKETYGRTFDSEQDAINALIEPTMLIVDEVGIQYNSQNERNLFYEVINGRYNEMKPTILITNCGKSQLLEYLDERIIDRLTDGGGIQLAFGWPSYRGRMERL